MSKTKRKYKLNWLQIMQRLESAQVILELSGDGVCQLDEAVECLRDRLDMPAKPLKAQAVKSQIVLAIESAHDHVKELRDAWQRGTLREEAWAGGTRSNRNVDVEVSLRKALEVLGAAP